MSELTSRELVRATLEFRNTDGRVPRQIWMLPWAFLNHPEKAEKIKNDFPADIVTVPIDGAPSPAAYGDPYAIGESADSWGCVFTNAIEGIIGEVKQPLVLAEDWSDTDRVHIPEEQLDFDIAAVNEYCRASDKFCLSNCCPRPFEQLQFIRGTEMLYMDLMDPPPKMLDFIARMHDFYCRLLTRWCQTEVDAVQFMDDWGAQSNLLISPALWVKYFKPLYADYIAIAKRYGKKIFMHSDGYTVPIFPHLIELGLDAINSQIFCMGTEALKPFAGKITFWGEIDRQHLLPYGTRDDIDAAVRTVYRDLWRDGGCIAQCEFSIGANPDNVRQVFETWQQLRP